MCENVQSEHNRFSILWKIKASSGGLIIERNNFRSLQKYCSRKHYIYNYE